MTAQELIKYFVTCDEKTILKKAKQHQEELEELQIKILSPLEFENFLGN